MATYRAASHGQLDIPAMLNAGDHVLNVAAAQCNGKRLCWEPGHSLDRALQQEAALGDVEHHLVHTTTHANPIPSFLLPPRGSVWIPATSVPLFLPLYISRLVKSWIRVGSGRVGTSRNASRLAAVGGRQHRTFVWGVLMIQKKKRGSPKCSEMLLK
jgi:hypothetical protein